MAPAYWINLARSISDPEKLAAYAELATPAIRAGGGEFLARSTASAAFEEGLLERSVIIRFPSVEAAVATHDGDAYQAALAALDSSAVRDMRVVEGTGAGDEGARLAAAAASYEAYARADRDAFEALLADGFTFSAPPDVGLDRAGYFERCWPGAGSIAGFDLVRLAAAGRDDVVVTYEATRADGTRFRNTELLGFAGTQIASVEVYFGWDL